MVITKVLDSYQMDLGYKNTKGESGPFSSSPQNVTVKVPWGPPISCDFRTKRDQNKDELVNEFKFSNKRRETACFDESLLYNIKSVTNFGQRVTSLYTKQKQKLLANYLTLLQFGKGFIYHNPLLHDADGFSLVGSGVTLVEVDSNGGTLSELRSFEL